ncbi:MAG: hypothetical protein VKM68_01100 [Cyanobacteriota bacterium]|nr:hypothetical protein [Cyanobacteriota bacterium]
MMILLALTVAPAPAPASMPLHLVWAERLLADLRPADNRYAGPPPRLTWRGVDGADRTSNSSDCSGFVTALLRRAYHLGPADLRRWLGSASPTAARYHEAISRADGFRPIERADAVEPGDLLAIRYQRSPLEGMATGHLMLAAERPRPLGAGRLALVVIDSSRTGHGPEDRRGSLGGAGRGTIALVVDAAGRPSAYTWSLRSGSPRLGPPRQELRIGRLLIPAGSPGR